MGKLRAFLFGVAAVMGANKFRLPYIGFFEPIPNLYFERELRRRANLPIRFR